MSLTRGGDLPIRALRSAPVSGDRDGWFDTLLADIVERAEESPWMTAVRSETTAITYGDLADSARRYLTVTNAEGMSTESAVVAAVLHHFPTTAQLPANEAAQTLTELIAWLGRGLPSPAPALRSAS